MNTGLDRKNLRNITGLQLPTLTLCMPAIPGPGRAAALCEGYGIVFGEAAKHKA